MEDAAICQQLKEVMFREPGWARLLPDQRQALEMIQVKVARILNGDPNWEDSWQDISGYATLVLNRLKEDRLFLLPAREGQPSSGELPTLLRSSEDQSTQSSPASQ